MTVRILMVDHHCFEVLRTLVGWERAGSIKKKNEFVAETILAFHLGERVGCSCLLTEVSNEVADPDSG